MEFRLIALCWVAFLRWVGGGNAVKLNYCKKYLLDILIYSVTGLSPCCERTQVICFNDILIYTWNTGSAFLITFFFCMNMYV